MAQPVDGHLFAAENLRLGRWLWWRHLIGGTVRNLSSWPRDPVVDDLSRFPKGFGRGRNAIEVEIGQLATPHTVQTIRGANDGTVTAAS